MNMHFTMGEYNAFRLAKRGGQLPRLPLPHSAGLTDAANRIVYKNVRMPSRIPHEQFNSVPF